MPTRIHSTAWILALFCAAAPVAQAPQAPAVKLRILARIDGVDEMRITHRRAEWKHHEWSWPTDVAINGRTWDPMPIQGLTEDFSWFTHPWALSHELMHGFGYGHGSDMDRVDQLVQQRFREFQWRVADDPSFVPEILKK